MSPPSLAQRNPEFAAKIAQMKLELAPIYPLPVGRPHPSFPQTVLQYTLLTEAELDDMAAYYSQSTPDGWTHQYPCPMGWDSEFLADPKLSDSARAAIKLRKFGKFIGLGGCATPVEETQMRIEMAQERLKRRLKDLRDEEERKTHGFNKWIM